MATSVTVPCFGWERVHSVNATPLYHWVPAIAESQREMDMPWTPGAPPLKYRLTGPGLFSHVSLRTTENIAVKLLSRLDGLDDLPFSKTFKGVKRPLLPKRIFLASIDPHVLVLVPHEFNPGDKEYKIYSAVQEEYYKKIWPHQEKLGQVYLRTALSHAFVNWLELSSVFPNAQGIEVLSDIWKKSVPLAEAEADPKWQFKTRIRADNPVLRELVPKGK
jgi:hypothetical protein